MYLDEFVYQLVALLTFSNILTLFGSVLLGIVFGALPGLTATLGVALLTSVTFGMPTDIAMISLIGIYVGAIYGGSHPAILLNIPGTAAAAATAMEGYYLCRSGRAGEAIATATVTSFIGTVSGVLAMLVFIPLLSMLASNFTSVEYALLAFFGVMICGSLTSPDTPVKGWIAGLLGLLISSVGIDPIQGYYRFTFGIPELFEGIKVIPVILGGFAIPQIIATLRPKEYQPIPSELSHLKPNWRIVKNKLALTIRSGMMGVGVGSIPGVGEDVAAWMSYDTAKKLSKESDQYGKGTIEGVIASETANNACIGGALIPLLTLGVPGSPPAAMLLGAIFLHGVRPGPLLPIEFPDFIPKISAILALASLTMLVCGLVITKLTVRVLKMPVAILMPFVAFFSVIGSYALGLNTFSVYLMFGFGILAYWLTEMGYPIAPLVIGVILGPMADENLRRALLASDGSLWPFIDQPIARVLTILIILTVAAQIPFLRQLAMKVFSRREKNDK